MLINGQWAKDFDPVQGTDDEGGFVREQSQFRNWITTDGSPGPAGEGGFVAEPDRYHLYVALICPWASRTLMARKLKGLEDVISVTVLDPRLTEKVWRFGDDKRAIPGTQSDSLYGAEYLYQIYLRTKSDYTGQITVPVLWDKHKETIVNNESSDIIRMFNNGFGNLARESIDLYPIDLRPEIDDVNNRLYDQFNNGVYRAGFATTQIAYERAVQEVFDSLDWIDRRLDNQDYLVGDRLTESDVRAFVTLIRFDLAYHGLFKTNLRQLRDYRNITAYVKRIYELPGIAETVSPEHIKIGYYAIQALNPSGIVPIGPTELW
jgi:putative glutathione S-transferase